MGKTYSMKQAAEMIDRSILTIKKWETEGLISPERDDRGWRQFTDDDIKQLESIKREKFNIKHSGIGGRVYEPKSIHTDGD
jgi:DNA-binding transcriptional MerR regulator